MSQTVILKQTDELLHAAMSGPSARNKTPLQLLCAEICPEHFPCNSRHFGYRTVVLQQRIFSWRRQTWGLVRYGAEFIRKKEQRKRFRIFWDCLKSRYRLILFISVIQMRNSRLETNGTTFYTKPFLFLFSKNGYKPIGKAVELVTRYFD